MSMTLEETKAFLAKEQQKNDLLEVMSTPGGRRFIWRQVLAPAGVFRSSFVSGAPDVTAFNEGARNFGLVLLGVIMSDAPDLYLKMQQEAIHEDQKRSRDNHGEEAGADSGGGDPHN